MTAEAGEITCGDRRVLFTVTRSKRRRRSIAFKMESAEAITILAPARASLSSIHALINRNTGWIARRMAKLQRAASALPPKDEESLTYLGQRYKISVTQDEAQPQGCRLLPRRMVVNFTDSKRGRAGVGGELVNTGNLLTSPPSIPPASGGDAWMASPTPADIRLELLLWLKKRAKVKLQRRMDVWAARLGVRYQKLVIANAEHRWGSCNAQNVIRLNWRLIMAPLPIIDYVVVHELCHVRHKNHGAGFWGQVASVMPDYQARRKRLRFIGGGLVL